MSKKVLVGKVVSAFGIKGEVKMASYCQDPLAIEKYPLFDSNGNPISLIVSNKNKSIVGTNNSGDSILIVKIDGVNDRNASELMRGKEIFANRADFNETEEDEFYYADLVELDVINLESEKIGKVINVFDHGAGGCLEIEFCKADMKKKMKEIGGFTFNHETFPEVNLESKFVRMIVPEIIEYSQDL